MKIKETTLIFVDCGSTEEEGKTVGQTDLRKSKIKEKLCF